MTTPPPGFAQPGNCRRIALAVGSTEADALDVAIAHLTPRRVDADATDEGAAWR